MVELATSLVPNADQKNGELELDLENLPDDALRKLSSFVNKCLRRANGNGLVDVDGSSSDSDFERTQPPAQLPQEPQPQPLQEPQEPQEQKETKIESEASQLTEEAIKPSVPSEPEPQAQHAEISTTPISDSTIATTTDSSVSADDQMVVEKTEQPQNVSPPPLEERKAENLVETTRPPDSVDAMVTS